MFKHILIPTDGSKLSEAALRAGLQLAREQDSEVTVLYVVPDYSALRDGRLVRAPSSTCLSKSFFWRSVRSFQRNSKPASNSSSV